MKTPCCARCTKPIVGEQFKVGRFTYGSCCISEIKQIEEEKNYVRSKVGKRVKGPVVAWKIFETQGGRLEGLRGFDYKVNKIYVSPSPGFQAFVNKKDAEDAVKIEGNGWLHDCVVRRVLLYNARQGVIDSMSGFCDGKRGWVASKICVPSLRKKKKK